MKRFVILGAALGAVLALAGAASAQTANPPATSAPPSVGRNFVDADGDGICDHCTGTPRGQGQGPGQKARRGRGGYGPGDGTGNQGVGPRDGSGYGPGAGSGNCNGSGPRGRGRRGGRG
jgi:hypothetical protein